MKKYALKMIIGSLALLFFFSACQRDNGRVVGTTTINIDGEIKIEYSGDIKLNSSKNAFSSISPNGYVAYKNKDKKMVVESDANGCISYKINRNIKTSTLNTEDKTFVANSIDDMLSKGAKF
jgi:hypothetical protein